MEPSNLNFDPLGLKKIKGNGLGMIHVQAYPLGGEMVLKRRHGGSLNFYIYIYDYTVCSCCRQGRLTLVLILRR